MSEEQRYNELLRKLDRIKSDIIDVEKDIKNEMKINHLKIDNRVSNVERTVKEHRSIFVAALSVIGLGVLGLILKAAGISI